MKLNKYLLPKSLIKAFVDVDPLEEIKKFLIGFDKAKSCDYLPHLKDEKLLKFINIPEDKMLFGQVDNLSHCEYNYEIYNPCADYFTEYLFGALFDLDCIKVKKCESEYVDGIVDDSNKFARKAINKLKIITETKEIYVYELCWTAGQGGDSTYYVLNCDDLALLSNKAFELHQNQYCDSFCNYLAARIMENWYQVTVLENRGHHPIGDYEDYLSDIVKSRHLAEYHWWEDR